eukprot:UN08067
MNDNILLPTNVLSESTKQTDSIISPHLSAIQQSLQEQHHQYIPYLNNPITSPKDSTLSTSPYVDLIGSSSQSQPFTTTTTSAITTQQYNSHQYLSIIRNLISYDNDQ